MLCLFSRCMSGDQSSRVVEDRSSQLSSESSSIESVHLADAHPAALRDCSRANGRISSLRERPAQAFLDVVDDHDSQTNEEGGPTRAIEIPRAAPASPQWYGDYPRYTPRRVGPSLMTQRMNREFSHESLAPVFRRGKKSKMSKPTFLASVDEGGASSHASSPANQSDSDDLLFHFSPMRQDSPERGSLSSDDIGNNNGLWD